MQTLKLTLISLLCFHTAFAFNFNDITKMATDSLNESSNSTSSSSTNAFSNDTLTQGLKEALQQGVKSAVDSLSKENGYLNNSDVKIPLPQSLQSAETLLRKAGAGNYADELIQVINQAASTAAPKTASVLSDTISKMSIEDANKILEGSNTAATDYFRKNTYDKLKNMITPIIKQSIASNDVAQYYDAFNSAYKTYGKDLVDNSGVMSYAKSFGVDKYIPSSSDESLDEYITTKTLDGLFTMIEKEEIAIRQNPANRTTELLQQIFQ